MTDRQLRTHAGIPVFGLYPDYLNTVEVSYTRLFDGKPKETLSTTLPDLRASGSTLRSNGTPRQHGTMFDTEVQTVEPEFKDRLYLVGNQLSCLSPGKVARSTWNNPMGGALRVGLQLRTSPSSTRPATSAGTSSTSSIYEPRDPWLLRLHDGLPADGRRRPHLRLRPALRQVRPHGPRDLQPPPAASATPTTRTPSTPPRTATTSCALPPPTTAVPTASASTRSAT